MPDGRVINVLVLVILLSDFLLNNEAENENFQHIKN
jgi:hypothetical protein